MVTPTIQSTDSSGPEHAQVEMGAAGQTDDLERPAGAHEQHRGDDLDQEFLGGRDADQVVDDAGEKDDERADREGDQLRAPDLHAAVAPLDHRDAAGAEGEAGDDREAAQARRRRLLLLASAGLVDRAHEGREAHDQRDQEAGDQARHRRRERRGEQGLGSRGMHGRIIVAAMMRLRRIQRSTWRHLPAILWAVILAVLLLTPGSELPAVEWGWIAEVDLGDKLLHALGFGIAAWLWHRSLAARPTPPSPARPIPPSAARPIPPPAAPLLLAVFLAVGYGALLEVAQSLWASGRDGSAWDALANGIGAAAYACLVLARRRPRPSPRGRIDAHESHRAPGERRAAAD